MRCRECEYFNIYEVKCELDNKQKFIKIRPYPRLPDELYSYEHIGLCEMDKIDEEKGD